MAAFKTLIPCLALVLLISLFRFCHSTHLHVGTRNASWQLPSYPDEFIEWSAYHRFQIGDSLVLKYDGRTDSVLEVTEEDYQTCNTSDPIKSYNDGRTKIVFDKSAPFFFISGAQGHCDKGQKLEIRVLSNKHVHFHTSPAPSPSPSPSPSGYHHHTPAPAPAPHNGGSVLKVGFIGGFAVAGILAFV